MSIVESKIDFEVFTVYRQDIMGITIVKLCNRQGALEYLREHEGCCSEVKYYALGDDSSLINLESEVVV